MLSERGESDWGDASIVGYQDTSDQPAQSWQQKTDEPSVNKEVLVSQIYSINSSSKCTPFSVS